MVSFGFSTLFRVDDGKLDGLAFVYSVLLRAGMLHEERQQTQVRTLLLQRRLASAILNQETLLRLPGI